LEYLLLATSMWCCFPRETTSQSLFDSLRLWVSECSGHDAAVHLQDFGSGCDRSQSKYD